VPLALLSGWLEVAAKLNPITYVLEAMRALLNTGWDAQAIWTSILACLALAAAMYVLAAFALTVRTRRV
jgi:ABC-2 type transport system permease protein